MTELAGSLPSTAPDDDIRGVVEIGGLLYVTGRNGGASSDHKLYVVDAATTTLLGTFSIPEPHQSSSQGTYGITKDLAGNILAAGVEGISAFDTAGNQVSTIRGDNGDIAMPLDAQGDPVVGNQGGGLDLMDLFGGRNYWGVAFDPAGDGGNGALIAGSTTNAVPILSLRTSSAKILEVINDGGGASIDTEGYAFDPERGTLWTNSSGDFGGGEGLYEFDWQNRTALGGGGEGDDYSIEATGRFIASVPRQAGMNAEGFGDLGIYAGGDPGSPWAASFDLVSTSQQNRIDNSRDDDFIGFHRLHQFAGLPGDVESFLAVSKDAGAGMVPFAATDAMLTQPGDDLFYKMDDNGRPNLGAPVAMIIINFPASAGNSGITPLAPLGIPGNFPELVAVSPFSVPGDFVSTALLFGGTVGGTVPITGPAGLPAGFATGDKIRSQFIYFEFNSPLFQLAASNEAGFLVVGINTIQFKLQAPSAFSVDLLDPFIQLSEFGGGDASTSITKMIISTKNGAVFGASSPLAATGSTMPSTSYFDINQGEMADRFIAGNAFGDILNPIVSGCNGTYRPIDPGGNPFTTLAPRSDTDVGLIYGDGLVLPFVNTAYNLGRGDPENLDDDGNPDPIPAPIDVSASPPYDASAVLRTEYGRGNGGCFFEWWPDVAPYTDGAGNPGTAYPYQTGFLSSQGQFALGEPGYDSEDPDPEGQWLHWPQTLEFNFTPGSFLGKTFGFDMDIDGMGALPDSGGGTAGLFVEVHLNNGTIVSGLTLPDGTNPDIGIIGW